MKKTVLALTAAFISAVCAARDPYVGYIYPSGIQAGTTNRFIVGGQKMWHLRGLHFGCTGLRVLKIERVPSLQPPTGMQRKHLKNWLDGIAKGVKTEPPKPDDPHISEWRSNEWYQALGTLPPIEIAIVERYLFVPRNLLQSAPSLSQMTIVTIAADQNAKPGVYDVSAWNDAGISIPRPFVVTAQQHRKESLYVPPHRKQPELSSADATLSGVVLDGQIMPGEIDAFNVRLSGGKRYQVKVTARELQPYIGDAVPGFFNPAIVVRDESDRILAKIDDTDRFRPDPCFDFKPPLPGVYKFEIHDVLFRGRADFVYSISVIPYTEVDCSAFGKEKKSDVSSDGVLSFSGVVGKAGEVCRKEFTVDKPGTRVFRVSARREGSPLDAVLVLKKASGGKPLAQWDDVTNKYFVGTVPQGECDPEGEYEFASPGRYVAEIADRTGHGGDGYFWNLEVSALRPDFEVYSTRSTLPLFRGRSLKVDFVINRKDGFEGPVTLLFPKDVKAHHNTATSGVDRISATITYVGAKPVELSDVKILARGKIKGKMEIRDVMPCNEHEQAFAWKHLVPAKTFVMRATPPKFIPKKQQNKKPRKQQGGKPGKK